MGAERERGRGRSVFVSGILAVLLVAPLLLVAGCGREEGRSRGEPPRADTGYGGQCVIGIKTDLSSFIEWFAHRAHEIEVIDLVFQPLARLDRETGEFRPALAESWAQGEDGRSLDFLLRGDAVWEDGQPVTAADVVFTHEMQTDPRTGWFGAENKRYIASVEALGAREVRFHFTRSYPECLHDAVFGNIYPAHLLRRVPPAQLDECEFNRQPIGCGPFRVGRRAPGEGLELLASESFFGGRPHLDRLEFRVVRDKQTRALLFESGSLDVLRLAGPEEFDRLRDAGFQGFEAASHKYVVLVWNTTDPLLREPRLRRALAMALDRGRMVKLIQRGHGAVVPGPIHPGTWAYDDDLPKLVYDPEAAIRILEQLGFRDSDGDGVRESGAQRLAFELVVPGGAQLYADTAALIRDDLARIGARVTTRPLEGGAYQDAVYERTAQAVLVSETADDKVDLTGLAHSSAIGEDGTNYAGYSNPHFDRLCEQALAAASKEEAREYWREACGLLMVEQPYTFLYYRNATHLFQPYLRGVRVDANGLFVNVGQWWDARVE